MCTSPPVRGTHCLRSLLIHYPPRLGYLAVECGQNRAHSEAIDLDEKRATGTSGHIRWTADFLRSTTYGELLNVDHAFRGACFYLLYSCRDSAGKFVERLGVFCVFACKHDGLSCITPLANLRIQLHPAQISDAKLSRSFLRAAARKNIRLLSTMSADEVAHVFHHAHDIYLHLREHFDRFTRIMKRNIGRRRNHDCPSKRHSLDERERNVTGSRRQVNYKVIKLSPFHRS